MGRGMREFKDSMTGDSKHEVNQFVIPADEPGEPATLVTTEPVEPAHADKPGLVAVRPTEGDRVA